MESIRDSIGIAASPEAAMRALTTQAGYNGWWSKDCVVPEQAGREATLRFDKAGTIVTMRWHIDSIDPKGRVKWTCVGHDMADWIGTTLGWTVAPEGGGVRVELDHAGWKGAPPEPVRQGWRHFLGSMKQYLETGRGEPW